MTAVVASNPSIDAVTAQKSGVISDVIAGETIPACVAVRIDDSTALVVASLGAAEDIASAVHGICPRAALINEPVAIYGVGTRFQWDSTGSLVPGAQYFLGATGGVDDTTTAGDEGGIFIAVSTKDLVLIALLGIGFTAGP